jgi:hypothetical protein
MFSQEFHLRRLNNIDKFRKKTPEWEPIATPTPIIHADAVTIHALAIN